MYGAGFDGEGDGFGLLAAAVAHQAGGPARLPAGDAVPAPMQAHAEPEEVVVLHATEVGGAPPLPGALAVEVDHRSLSTMQMTRSRLQLPPPRPRAALPPAGKVPAGGRLILWAPAEGDHNTPLLRWTQRHAISCLAVPVLEREGEELA